MFCQIIWDVLTVCSPSWLSAWRAVFSPILLYMAKIKLTSFTYEIELESYLFKTLDLTAYKSGRKIYNGIKNRMKRIYIF